jgi:hypothetical protein
MFTPRVNPPGGALPQGRRKDAGEVGAGALPFEIDNVSPLGLIAAFEKRGQTLATRTAEIKKRVARTNCGGEGLFTDQKGVVVEARGFHSASCGREAGNRLACERVSGG